MKLEAWGITLLFPIRSYIPKARPTWKNQSANLENNTTHTFTKRVKCEIRCIFSVDFVPVPVAQSAGGLTFVAESSLNPEKRWSSLTRKKVASWYANCWPRQMRGPALKGQKMNGFGVRYLCTLSSRNRSGSNLRALSQSEKWTCAEYYRDTIPSGPQRSVLRWRLMTPYMQLEKVLSQTAKGLINSTHVVFAGMYNGCWFRGVTTTGRVDRLVKASDG